MEKHKKVYVAMSGGVDSSLSAALLKEEGRDVTGVFIKVWQPDWLTCTWPKDRLDAMRVCAVLNIPFKTFDFEKEYKQEVVDYMLGEYTKGATPNPDVMCNKYIKFGAFFEQAMQEGADMVATGHYARVQDRQLLRGVDESKDQSYFLWTLTKDILDHTLFPIGEMQKQHVRKEAEKRGLHVAEKKDSQGICFIGKVGMRDFLKHYIDAKEGKVLDEEGEVIGTHEGAFFYTIGQRHGFTVTDKTPESSPYYVVAKDIGSNTLTVSDTYDPTTTHVVLENTNWIVTLPNIHTTYQYRFRHRQPLARCELTTIDAHKQKVSVSFAEPQKSVALGQSLVLYDGDMCLGGGIIRETYST